MIERGAWRVAMGTAAIEDQNMVWDLCRTYPGRMMVSIDVLENEELATRGWTSNSGRHLEEVLLEMSSAGVSGFFISEARRDILTEAPNLSILRSALEYVDEPVIAAGGVRHLDDLREMMMIEEKGRTLAGLVVGREVTEGRFTVEEAQATLTGTDHAPLSRVRQVRAVVHCSSLDRSTEFYEGTLGFRRLDSWTADTHDGVLVEASDGRLVELLAAHDADGYQAPHGVGLVFVVDDVDSWHGRIETGSVKILMGLDDRPWGHRSFGLEDPDGVLITIAQIIR
jgi:catechol 2,3-dioxygenase-like lactoylglutathione lyase family enzyme